MDSFSAALKAVGPFAGLGAVAIVAFYYLARAVIARGTPLPASKSEPLLKSSLLCVTGVTSLALVIGLASELYGGPPKTRRKPAAPPRTTAKATNRPVASPSVIRGQDQLLKYDLGGDEATMTRAANSRYSGSSQSMPERVEINVKSTAKKTAITDSGNIEMRGHTDGQPIGPDGYSYPR